MISAQPKFSTPILKGSMDACVDSTKEYFTAHLSPHLTRSPNIN